MKQQSPPTFRPILVREARASARQWVDEQAAQLPGFMGAYFAGSVLQAGDGARLALGSDLDVMVVLADSIPPTKLGKFLFQGVLLEVTYLALEQVATAEQVLSDYHLAGSFRVPSIIADPSGHLTRLHHEVSRAFAARPWVERRCRQAMRRVEERIQAACTPAPWPAQVMAYLFAAGGMPHCLLVAGLENPTVRRRYVAARTLLATLGRLDLYENLLAWLGCHAVRQEQVASHLTALEDLFDATQAVLHTPFPYASDLRAAARPIAIDGSWEMIAAGDHREALFWIAVTYTRCIQVLSIDGTPGAQASYDTGFRQLLGDLGIATPEDLHRRCAQIGAALPALWRETETILDTHPGIQHT